MKIFGLRNHIQNNLMNRPLFAQSGVLARRRQEAVVSATQVGGWGWFPVLSLLSGFGVLLLSVAYTGARVEQWWAAILFWVALLLMFVPTTIRMTSVEPSRKERLALITMLGMGLYLVKVLHSPIGFTFHDEFVHWRTALDINQTGHLFRENPTIPVSPLYPGLEILTDGLAKLGGLDIYTAGILVLGVARCVLVLAVYLFIEELSRSSRVAGLATLLYMGNPNFVFFGAQFSYESISIPLLAMVLYLTARRVRVHTIDRVGLNLAVILTIGATVVTHHLTAYAMTFFLVIWFLVTLLWNRVKQAVSLYKQNQNWREIWAMTKSEVKLYWKKAGKPSTQEWAAPAIGGTMLLSLVISLAWLVFVASLTVGYIAPVVRSAVIEVLKMIAGEASGRQLFKASTGQVAPLWEQLTGFASVGLILLGLPFGLLRIWRHAQNNPLALTLGIAALAYPASLGMRLTNSGWEISNRSSEFIFIAVSFAVALGFTEVWLSRKQNWEWVAAFTVCSSLIFLGGIIAGWSPYARMPGSYLAAADTRSIEPQSVQAAGWMYKELGPANRVAADRVNSLLMLSYGQQRMVMGGGDGINVAPIFMSQKLGGWEMDLIQKGKIRYAVVDERLSRYLPQVGIYYEAGEPDTYQHRTPLDLGALQKFNAFRGVNRLFDSGDIVVYDIGVLQNGLPEIVGFTSR